MERTKILVAMPTGEKYRDKFQKAWPDAEFVYLDGDLVTAEDMADTDILIGNVPVPLLKAGKKLKWVQMQSAGSDNYAKAGVLPEDVLLTNSTGSYSPALSEYVVAVTFAMMRHLPAYLGQQKAHLWQDLGSNDGVGGSTVVILGFGDIGQACGERFAALGANVIGVRRHADPCPFAKVVTDEEMDDVLPLADVVVMVLPNSPATTGVMNAKRIASLKDGAYLVNVGRGPAVDREAMREALESGHLAGAAIDVTDPEPLPADDPLWDVPNLIITPHISGGFRMPITGERVTDIAADNMVRFREGRTLRNLVDRETGYRRYEKP